MYILKNANSFLTNAEVLGGSGLAGRAVAPTAKAQNFLSASCLKNFQTFFASYCLRTRSIDIVQNKYTNIDKSAVFYHAEPGLSRGFVKITGEVGK